MTAEPSTTVLNLSHAECAARAEAIRPDGIRVELDLSTAADPAGATFRSVSTLQFAATVEQTWVDIVADRICSATLNGRELDISGYDGARLIVPGLQAENTVVVRADASYSRTGEGLHRFTDPQDGNTYLYTHFEPTDARRVFACFEQPDLKARFTFEVAAPESWQVLSGQPEQSRTVADGIATVTFEPTPPLSSYIAAVAAGPFHRENGSWTGASGEQIDLGVLCRQAMRQHLDHDEILTVTRQGLDFFHTEFGYPYPWGKYDQIFLPEFNIGAMENPGLVTFTEAYLPRGTATRTQLEGRAEVILHEMTHMWFGDLVTPRWWDGLWLKESFADLMGYQVAAEATDYHEAWTAFAANRKQWAYRQDQLPTTHPIVATIDDLEAARQNFDGITYAKGAAVLKQLLAYVGREEFFAGARAYFADHAFGNTDLDDLLSALAAASGRDLSTWSRAWLQTAGTCELTPVVERDTAGRISRLLVRRTATDPVTGDRVDRPHRLRIGFYRAAGSDAAESEPRSPGAGTAAGQAGQPVGSGAGTLVRDRLVELDLAAAETEVLEAVGAAGDLVLVNDDDLSYAQVRLDPGSLATVAASLSTLDSSLTRSLVWSMVWNATRDALLPATKYLALVAGQLPLERDPALVRIAADQARSAVERFVGRQDRPAARSAVLAMCADAMNAADPLSDAQLTWARVLAAIAATTPDGVPVVRGLLDGSAVPRGLRINDDLRWSWWAALAAQDAATDEDLARALAADNSMTGRTAHLRAGSGRPDPAVADRTWASMTTDRALTNDQLRAMVTGFRQPSAAADRERFVEPYFAGISDWWMSRSMVMASILVGGLFPGGDLSGAEAPEDHPTVIAARNWLSGNESAPAALRRLVIESLDDLLRALRAQELSVGGSTDS